MGNATENIQPKAPAVSDGPTYNQQQVVFCLNILSNISAVFNGNDAVTIQGSTSQAIDAVLNDPTVQSYIGNWKRVWGPYVAVTSDLKAENTMYIAQQEGTGQCVVAIAGTDPTCIDDWFFEDFNAATAVAWPFGSNLPSPTPKITQATDTGLTALVKMTYPQYPNNGSGTPQSAFSFLQALNPQNITVTGHSLGGALSPAYALYLKNNMPQTTTILCLAVAGATPGDEAFVNYYTSLLGNTTERVWNSFDVVPHAFQVNGTNMVGEIPKLYVPPLKWDVTLDPFIAYAEGAGKLYNLQQLSPSTMGFASWIYTAANVNNPKIDPTTYLGQVVCQHIPSYAFYFKILSFSSAVSSAVNANFGTTLLQYPFFTEGCTDPNSN